MVQIKSIINCKALFSHFMNLSSFLLGKLNGGLLSSEPIRWIMYIPFINAHVPNYYSGVHPITK